MVVVFVVVFVSVLLLLLRAYVVCHIRAFIIAHVLCVCVCLCRPFSATLFASIHLYSVHILNATHKHTHARVCNVNVPCVWGTESMCYSVAATLSACRVLCKILCISIYEDDDDER